MAIKTLILGLSGTGKSCSLRNMENIAVVNPVNKPLPFKNHFEFLNGVTDSDKIVKFMKATKAKTIVIDDFQYILSMPFMKRIKEGGWDKYNDFASNYMDIINVCDELPEDVTVYFLSHTETLDDGTESIKLIGKLLREKICIEGLFTTVLKTMVNDGKYYFVTQNNGHDRVKSPMYMFDSYAIDNDLSYVDAKIRSYYEFYDAKSEEEMAELDEKAKTDIEPPKSREERRRERRKASDIAEAVEEAKAEIADKPTEERKQRKSREEVIADNAHAIATANAEDKREEIPFEEATDPVTEEVPRRRRRRTE